MQIINDANNVLSAHATKVAKAYKEKGLFAYASGEADTAIRYLNKSLYLDYRDEEIFCCLGSIYIEKGDNRKARDMCDCALVLNDNCQEAHTLKNSIPQALPFFILSTLPKSGSAYIQSVLSESLNIDRVKVSQRLFYNNNLVMPELKKAIASHDTFARMHLPATKWNIALLKKAGIDRIVIHVRDPRQALLSFVHWMSIENIYEMRLWGMSSELIVHSDYFLWQLKNRIDYALKEWASYFIKFINDWYQIKKVKPFNGLNVMITQHYEIKEDEEKFFKRILDFNNISADRFNYKKKIPVKGKLNFRSGEIDEWRRVYTHQQMREINKKIPEYLFEYFGWKK